MIEVSNFNSAIWVPQNVRGFDVAVDYFLLQMKIGKALRDLEQNAFDLGRAQFDSVSIVCQFEQVMVCLFHFDVHFELLFVLGV